MDNQASNNSPSTSSKGKTPLNKLADATTAPSGSSSSPSAAGTLAAMANNAVDLARNTLSALDPRHADVVRLNGAMANGSGGSSSSFSASAKPSTSASQSTFRHASRAMETLSESSSSRTQSSSANSGTMSSTTGFRTPAPATAQPSSGTGMMDWDAFLASPESDLIDDTPYRPPSMSSFSFSSMQQTSGDTSTLGTRQQLHQPVWEQDQRQSAHASHVTDTTRNLAPPTTFMSATATAPSTFALNDTRHGGDGGGALTSRMVQQQRMEDGMEVVAFLNSTSYTDYVEALEAVEVDRHQQQRKQFQYNDPHTPTTTTTTTTTNIIRQQDLPSDQQDIVAYAEGQRTMADDIDARPFDHDEVGQELRSLMAERAEKERFLQGIMSLKNQASGSGEDVAETSGTGEKEATLEEMEKIMARITNDSSQGGKLRDETEVSSTAEGETKDKPITAKNRQAALAAAARRKQQNGPRL
ncbi:hypothetical protein BGW41_001759 [Actinomortierella wolfii]|nr:hypothetical protein BGW41_001759 [Actinomortierella wolfii]